MNGGKRGRERELTTRGKRKEKTGGGESRR